MFIERSDRLFARLVGLAALLDVADRGDDLARSAEHLRVPVELVGIQLPSPAVSPLLGWALAGLWMFGALLLLGGPHTLTSRAGAPLVVFGSGLPLLLDQQHYANHTFLILCLSGIIALAGPATPWVLGTTVRSQISVVYLATAASKVRPEWWSGDVIRRSADGPLGLTVARDLPDRALAALAIWVIVVELALALLVWSERFRPEALVVASAFHLGILAVIGIQLGLVVFAIAMLAHFTLPRRTSGPGIHPSVPAPE